MISEEFAALFILKIKCITFSDNCTIQLVLITLDTASLVHRYTHTYIYRLNGFNLEQIKREISTGFLCDAAITFNIDFLYTC